MPYKVGENRNFFNGLFNNSVIIEGFTVLKDELVKIWKEGVAQSRSQAGICLGDWVKSLKAPVIAVGNLDWI